MKTNKDFVYVLVRVVDERDELIRLFNNEDDAWREARKLTDERDWIMDVKKCEIE